MCGGISLIFFQKGSRRCRCTPMKIFGTAICSLGPVTGCSDSQNSYFQILRDGLVVGVIWPEMEIPTAVKFTNRRLKVEIDLLP